MKLNLYSIFNVNKDLFIIIFSNLKIYFSPPDTQTYCLKVYLISKRIRAHKSLQFLMPKNVYPASKKKWISLLLKLSRRKENSFVIFVSSLWTVWQLLWDDGNIWQILRTCTRHGTHRNNIKECLHKKHSCVSHSIKAVLLFPTQ